jgi:hypothetical protein
LIGVYQRMGERMNTMLFVLAVAGIVASVIFELLKQWRHYEMRKYRRAASR